MIHFYTLFTQSEFLNKHTQYLFFNQVIYYLQICPEVLQLYPQDLGRQIYHIQHLNLHQFYYQCSLVIIPFVDHPKILE